MKNLEDKFYNKKTQQKIFYLLFAGIFVFIFALNYFFPIYCDDMMYSVVKYGESVNLSENLKEIASFLQMYYFEWGGRLVAHIVVHLLLLFNKVGQDVINTLVYCILVYLAYKICIGKKTGNVFVLLFLAVSFFYFTPSFLSSAIWITGSANYLWMITLTLAFIYPFYSLFNGKSYTDSKWRMVVFFIFGIIASWTNENLAPVLFIILVAYLAYYYLEHKSLPLWTIAGLIGVIIGCSLMILAPGNAVRAEAEGYAGLFSSLDRIGLRLPSIQASYRYFMLRPILIYLFSIVLFYYYPAKGISKKKVFFQSLLFFLGANISIGLTAFAPTFPPRAFMSITVLTIVSIGILYASINLRQALTRVVNIVFLSVLLLYASIDYMTFLKGSYFLHKQMNIREQIIDEAKTKGENSVTFEAIHLDYRFEYSDFANYYKDYYNIDAKFIEEEDK